MTNQTEKSRGLPKTLKLFLLILALLLVPLILDQAGVDREKVRLAGRVAAGLTGVLFLYGLFSKVLKIMGFVVLLLIGLTLLVAEGKIEAPRVKDLFAARTDGK